MTIHYSDAVAAARLQKVIDAIDGGASFGTLVVGTSALAGGGTGVLFSITLEDPSATITGRVLTFEGTPIDATATGVGTASKAEIRDSDGVVVVNGLTVGVVGSGANIVMDTTGIVIGRPVRLVSASITHP